MMEKEVKFCKNCKRSISANNFVIHTVHCERNIKLCERCFEPVPRGEFEVHEEEFHSEENCSDCGVSVEKWRMEKHKETCDKKLVSCEYCDLEVPLDSISEHMVVCGSRTEQCLKCKKHVMKKDLGKHATYCLRKEPELMPCDYCDGQIDLNELEVHTVMCGTRTERCFLCSQHVMVKDRDAHFETCGKEICDKKLVSCKYCELETTDNIFEHMAACGSRTELCLKCKMHVMKKDLSKHSSNCSIQTISKTHGSCPVCHQSIPWVEMNVHSAACAQIHYEVNEYERQNQFNEYALRKESEASADISFAEKNPQISKQSKRCTYCHELFPSHMFSQHLEACQERPYNCEKCLKAMPYRKKEEHVHTCHDRPSERHYRNDYMPPDENIDGSKEWKKLKKCQFCNKKFTDVLFQHHEKDCEHRKEQCNFCEQNVRVKDMLEHRSLKCFAHGENSSPNYHVSVHSQVIPEPSWKSEAMGHLERYVEKCPSCELKIPKERYSEHLHLCFEGRTECHFCGIELNKKFMHEHLRGCRKILEMIEEDKNSQSKKKKGEKNEGKGLFGIKSWFLNHLDMGNEKSKTSAAFEKPHSWDRNKGQSYERGGITSIKPSTEVFNEVPCEFCNEMWPFELLIEHQSGCRPDLVSYPKSQQDGDKEFAAVAKVSPTYTPIKGVNPKSFGEYDNEWNVQSRRNRLASSQENVDSEVKERNMPQKQQLSNKEKFFYYPSQDSDKVPKCHSGSSNKKRYPQLKKSPEFSKEQCPQLRKSPEIPKEQYPQLRKSPEIPKEQYPQLRKSPEIPKKQYPQLRKSPEIPKKEYPQMCESPETCKTKCDEDVSESCEDKFTGFRFSASRYWEESQKDTISEEKDTISEEKVWEFSRTIGAERAKKNPNSFNMGFEEMSLLKSTTFVEDNKRNECVESTPSNLNLRTVWNKDSNLLKPFNSNYDNKTEEDILSHTVQNMEHTRLDSNIQDTDYDEKNAETFGSDFLESINNNQIKEDESETHSNSDDTFYDADDGGAKFIDVDDNNIHVRNNTQDSKLSHNDLKNLNLLSRCQEESLNPSTDENFDDWEDPRYLKDYDMGGYYKYLFKQRNQTCETDKNKISSRTPVNCSCDNKECSCGASSVKKKTSFPKACSLKDSSCSKDSLDSTNTKPLIERLKMPVELIPMESSLEFRNKIKVDNENYANDEKLEWVKWRRAGEASDSD